VGKTREREEEWRGGEMQGEREGEGEEVPCREREERKGTVHLSAQSEQSLLNKATCYLQVLLCLKKPYHLLPLFLTL
jgi:hypothetical protein